MIIALFFPGNVEYLLIKANSYGNMVLHNIFLRVYYTRNILYFSIPILCISCYNHFIDYSYALFLFLCFVILFRNACSKACNYR